MYTLVCDIKLVNIKVKLLVCDIKLVNIKVKLLVCDIKLVNIKVKLLVCDIKLVTACFRLRRYVCNMILALKTGVHPPMCRLFTWLYHFI